MGSTPGWAKEQAKAVAELTKADGQTNIAKRIQHFGKAWERAQKALGAASK